MVEPLSEDARIILAVIRKYPMIERNRIERELGINVERIMRGASELYQRNLIGIEFLHRKGNFGANYFEIVNFYPN
jgi:hypothetical protein